MPQNPFGGPQPIGVVYNTSMSRPDAALALAELYGMQSKREARIGSVCVNGAGLNTAIYCDIVGKFYTLGPPRNANQVLPVGLAAVDPLPPDPPMVKTAVAGSYDRTVRKLSDTSLAEAVLRNGVIFNAEAAVILSAPATCLARSLDLLGVRDLYKERVKRLVIVDAGTTEDVRAMRKVIAEWPTPIFYCGKPVGEGLRFPAERIEKDFAWATAHPVVDAYRSYAPMPYDSPTYDLAAVHYAVHPDSGFFTLQGGTLSVDDDGQLRFKPGAGNVKSLEPVEAQREKAIDKFVELASAKPIAPPQRVRPPSNAADTKTPPKK